jgi:hypothetical protein
LRFGFPMVLKLKLGCSDASHQQQHGSRHPLKHLDRCHFGYDFRRPLTRRRVGARANNDPVP